MAETQVKDEAVEQAETGHDASVEVQEATLPEAADTGAKSGGGQIDVLLDTKVPVTVRLGQVELQVRDLLQLGSGSVLQLDKQVGEPADLFLRGVRFATGTLVVVEDRLGVRINEILSPAGDGEAEGASG